MGGKVWGGVTECGMSWKLGLGKARVDFKDLTHCQIENGKASTLNN